MSGTSFVEYVMIRRRSGDTLRAIGEDFGVSLVTVARWCDGTRNPRKAHCKLAEMMVREQLARGLGKDWPEFK